MKYPIFDGHCDTMSEMYNRKEVFEKNSFHIDAGRMKRYDKYAQIFAAFVDKKRMKTSPYEHILNMLDFFKQEALKNDISVALSSSDIEKLKQSAILAIEGGEAAEGSLEKLEGLYEKGVRLMTLTWNYRNEICDGIDEKDGRGLTEFGKQTVKKMNELGMVVDVSHISEQGFWDTVSVCVKPFVASHSAVKAICNHRRNLTDEQIKEIISLNGVIGINFYPLFLDNFGKCKAERILEHMEYILELGGENNVGLGSDFDGINSLPEEIKGIESMDYLISLMEKRGYGEKIIQKITFENFLRIFESNLSKNTCNF